MCDQCSECQREEIQKARVNGGRNYDSLKHSYQDEAKSNTSYKIRNVASISYLLIEYLYYKFTSEKFVVQIYIGFDVVTKSISLNSKCTMGLGRHPDSAGGVSK